MPTVKSFVQVKLPADPGAALEAATQQYADTKQPLDSDLTTLAGLAATTDSFIQAKSSAWAARTIAQVKTDLAVPTVASDIGAEPALTPTASKTSAYTAVSGDLVMCDGTSGAFTVTLPAAAAGRFVGVKKTDSGANLITISRAGSDTIGAGAATSITLALQDETVVLMASGTTWVRKENQLTLSTLDTRFQASDSDLTTLAGLAATTNNMIVSVSSAWASRTPAQVKTTLALDLVDNTSDATKLSAVRTLTNARITKRIGTTTSSSSLTIDSDSYDQYNVTALAAAITMNNPSGTPTDGQMLLMRFKDNATARAFTWSGSQWRAVGVALPATTVISKTLYVGSVWNAADTKWDAIAVVQEA